MSILLQEGEDIVLDVRCTILISGSHNLGLKGKPHDTPCRRVGEKQGHL
jgi:hypothetical protein